MINLWRSLRFTIVFAVLLGLIYPLFVTGVGNILFPFTAQGSLVEWHGQVVGSRLIAEATTRPDLFHPRPSAVAYAGNGSGGSNFGPTNPKLSDEVRTNLLVFMKQNPTATLSQISTSMVESSASGLDPDISVQDALLQVKRISQVTGLSDTYLIGLINRDIQRRTLGIWGEPVINVMDLNLDLLRKENKK